MATCKAAVVTAPNIRFVNTGMISVELAAKAFLQRFFPSCQIQFYSIIPPDPPGEKRWMMMDLGYVHESATSIDNLFRSKPMPDRIDEIFSHDLILYWGDFLQARHYINTECINRLKSVYHLDSKQAFSIAFRGLLQADEPESVASKSIVFGSSLLSNSSNDYCQQDYNVAVSAFFRKVRAALLRDPISATRVAHIRRAFTQTHLGQDPAFLLNDNDLSALPTTPWSANLRNNSSIGLFFGTRTRIPRRLLPFCERVARDLGVSVEWIPWFPYHEILKQRDNRSATGKHEVSDRKLLRMIQSLSPRGLNYKAGDLLSSLGKYRAIITDTYHLCINAWRAGTPAICFGAETSSSNAVISDFKKRVLYEMYDAKEFYFDTSFLADSADESRLARKVASLLENPLCIDFVLDRVRTHSAGVEEMLKDFTSTIVG